MAQRTVSMGEARRAIARSIEPAFDFVVELVWNDGVLGRFALAGV
jgi:hypothetical protein